MLPSEPPITMLTELLITYSMESQLILGNNPPADRDRDKAKASDP